VELDGQVLVIRRIHVVYRLEAAADARETIDRVHGLHKEHCPIYRSIGSAIAMTTEVVLEPPRG
jgi:uncharacterized OsmC-like protein